MEPEKPTAFEFDRRERRKFRNSAAANLVILAVWAGLAAALYPAPGVTLLIIAFLRRFIGIVRGVPQLLTIWTRYEVEGESLMCRGPLGTRRIPLVGAALEYRLNRQGGPIMALTAGNRTLVFSMHRLNLRGLYDVLEPLVPVKRWRAEFFAGPPLKEGEAFGPRNVLRASLRYVWFPALAAAAIAAHVLTWFPASFEWSVTLQWQVFGVLAAAILVLAWIGVFVMRYAVRGQFVTIDGDLLTARTPFGGTQSIRLTDLVTMRWRDATTLLLEGNGTSLALRSAYTGFDRLLALLEERIRYHDDERLYFERGRFSLAKWMSFIRPDSLRMVNAAWLGGWLLVSAFPADNGPYLFALQLAVASMLCFHWGVFLLWNNYPNSAGISLDEKCRFYMNDYDGDGSDLAYLAAARVSITGFGEPMLWIQFRTSLVYALAASDFGYSPYRLWSAVRRRYEGRWGPEPTPLPADPAPPDNIAAFRERR